MDATQITGVKTFLNLVRHTGHRGQKKVRRWMVYFALNFNLSLKQWMQHN